MPSFRIGVIGLGKIAQDQHLPVIGKSSDFELVAVSSQRGLAVDSTQAFQDHRDLLAGMSDVECVAICTPPQVRYAIARDALLAGKHVMLEKPPAATLSELADLERLATVTGRVLMTTWHSQYNDGVDEAKRLLAEKRVSQLLVNWREDVRKWHPGQAWIFEAGGYGVFDPGINALSIVTKVMPEPLFVREAELIFPSNRDAPIAATMRFASGEGDEELRAEFDWRPIDREVWEITVGTDDGTILHLSKGGAKLDVNGQTVMDQRPEEYEAIYRHFADLLHGGRSHVDPAPMRLVADAFMLGRRAETEPFSDS